MAAARRRKSLGKILKSLLLPAGIILVLVFIFMQTFSSERGLFTWYSLQHQVEIMQAENDILKQEIADLERQVERLQDKNPDWDYIEEQARKMLPVAKPNEEVIFLAD